MESSKYLAEIVDSIPTAVVVLDPHGVIVLVNAQAETLFGYARGDLLGEPVEILTPRRFWSGGPEKYGPMATDGDFRGLHKDGTEFPIEIRSNSVETKDGPVIVSTIVGIAERQQMETGLRAR